MHPYGYRNLLATTVAGQVSARAFRVCIRPFIKSPSYAPLLWVQTGLNDDCPSSQVTKGHLQRASTGSAHLNALMTFFPAAWKARVTML